MRPIASDDFFAGFVRFEVAANDAAGDALAFEFISEFAELDHDEIIGPGVERDVVGDAFCAGAFEGGFVIAGEEAFGFVIGAYLVGGEVGFEESFEGVFCFWFNAVEGETDFLPVFVGAGFF